MPSGSSASRAKQWFDIITNVAVVSAAVAFIWVVFRPNATAGGPGPVAAASATGEDVRELRIDSSRLPHMQGSGNVVLVEFADYECPFCGSYARDVYPAVKESLVATGRVRYAFVNFPLESIHPLARRASEAAECASQQGRFWEMHERLFADVSRLAPTRLVGEAGRIGLDTSTFSECLASRASAKVRADIAMGIRLGVTGTPTFFVGLLDDTGSVVLKRRIPGLTSLQVLTDEVARFNQ